MDFPIADLMDQDACYAMLLESLHPAGLACPRSHQSDRMAVHRRHRAPVLDDRCGSRRRVFNAFTGTALHGSGRRPAQLILILRGIAQGVPTAQLARELDCDRSELHKLRHEGPRRRMELRPVISNLDPRGDREETTSKSGAIRQVHAGTETSGVPDAPSDRRSTSPALGAEASNSPAR